ncbi:DUF2768 domain-containing protein [Cohnella lubricantis]|uniref:DUF2768 family protein n=1 Tax=Cohnella lubricantis TaxID=2163172 RepID=A0A841T8W0_9BACL|nr:DUF2768 family protein [Cohnella lubricantis]MBB6677734.1 DUF2768 family protein [Cohnella lubricantis]MBP2117696.1 hypothetical protein [Cohnella lubricantis]
MDPMMKMWVSFVGIGLMVLSAVVIMLTRAKTRGVLRLVLSLIAFVMLFAGMVCGLISIV